MIIELQRVIKPRSSKPCSRLLLCHFVCKAFRQLNDNGTTKGYQALSSPVNERALERAKQRSGVKRNYKGMYKAGDGIRTHDHLLGKQVLYR
jgi:hypothetical protein